LSIDKIARLLGRCDSPENNFPPTELYNEGWMLRLVLDWFSSNPGIDHELSFTATDKWYSEALLPSAFLARYRGDKLAESWTHVDGVIGDFEIGVNRDGDLSLVKGASRILVTEAKMYSKLSSGVKNAGYFDQAARNIACIAEVLCRAQMQPSSFSKIGFYVIAPESQIAQGAFAEFIATTNIQNTVGRRVSEYKDSEKDSWLATWFVPTLQKIRIQEISWEDLVTLIVRSDPAFGKQIDAFYRKCLEFNTHVQKAHRNLTGESNSTG
jgi:hypothetical protein